MGYRERGYRDEGERYIDITIGYIVYWMGYICTLQCT